MLSSMLARLKRTKGGSESIENLRKARATLMPAGGFVTLTSPHLGSHNLRDADPPEKGMKKHIDASRMVAEGGSNSYSRQPKHSQGQQGRVQSFESPETMEKHSAHEPNGDHDSSERVFQGQLTPRCRLESNIKMNVQIMDDEDLRDYPPSPRHTQFDQPNHDFSLENYDEQLIISADNKILGSSQFESNLQASISGENPIKEEDDFENMPNLQNLLPSDNQKIINERHTAKQRDRFPYNHPRPDEKIIRDIGYIDNPISDNQNFVTNGQDPQLNAFDESKEKAFNDDLLLGRDRPLNLHADRQTSTQQPIGETIQGGSKEIGSVQPGVFTRVNNTGEADLPEEVAPRKLIYRAGNEKLMSSQNTAPKGGHAAKKKKKKTERKSSGKRRSSSALKGKCLEKVKRDQQQDRLHSHRIDSPKQSYRIFLIISKIFSAVRMLSTLVMKVPAKNLLECLGGKAGLAMQYAERLFYITRDLFRGNPQFDFEQRAVIQWSSFKTHTRVYIASLVLLGLCFSRTQLERKRLSRLDMISQLEQVHIVGQGERDYAKILPPRLSDGDLPSECLTNPGGHVLVGYFLSFLIPAHSWASYFSEGGANRRFLAYRDSLDVHDLMDVSNIQMLFFVVYFVQCLLAICIYIYIMDTVDIPVRFTITSEPGTTLLLQTEIHSGSHLSLLETSVEVSLREQDSCECGRSTSSVASPEGSGASDEDGKEENVLDDEATTSEPYVSDRHGIYRKPSHKLEMEKHKRTISWNALSDTYESSAELNVFPSLMSELYQSVVMESYERRRHPRPTQIDSEAEEEVADENELQEGRGGEESEREEEEDQEEKERGEETEETEEEQDQGEEESEEVEEDGGRTESSNAVDSSDVANKSEDSRNSTSSDRSQDSGSEHSREGSVEVSKKASYTQALKNRDVKELAFLLFGDALRMMKKIEYFTHRHFLYFIIVYILLSYNLYISTCSSDCISTLFVYASILFILNAQWGYACVMYSMSLSLQARGLLYAPGFSFIIYYVASQGCKVKAARYLCLCGLVPLITSVPFLLRHPVSYLTYTTYPNERPDQNLAYNAKFLPSYVFNSPVYSFILRVLYLVAILLIYITVWKTMVKRLSLPAKLTTSQFDKISNSERGCKANQTRSCKNESRQKRWKKIQPDESEENRGESRSEGEKGEERKKGGKRRNKCYRNRTSSKMRRSSLLRYDHSKNSYFVKSLAEQNTFVHSHHDSANTTKGRNIYNLIEPHDLLYILFSSALIGIICTKNTTFHFYTWCFYFIPYIFIKMKPAIYRGIVFLLTSLLLDWAYHVYPPTPISSISITSIQISLLALLVQRVPHSFTHTQ